MTWTALVWRNLLRRPARTALTATGVGLGVALIVALLAITSGVHRTAQDLIHIGRSDFGVFQGDVSDITRSLLPESLASSIGREPGVADVAKVKLLVDRGRLLFGLDATGFAYRRLVLLRGRGGGVLAGDHSGKDVGDRVRVGRRTFVVGGVYHSGDHFEDLGFVLPLRTLETIARRPGEITTLGVVVKLGHNANTVARRIERRYPGTVAVTEPGQAIKVDTSSRLIVSTGWIISILALIVGGIGVTNTMAMSVFERIREIGTLRAVGWRTRRIAAMIVCEALGICLFALGVGCGLGVLAAEVFVAHSALSDLISPAFTAGTFAWGLAFALGVGMLGAAYPTWRAIRLAPITALRRE
jgi:putative ABC transport system permease protein